MIPRANQHSLWRVGAMRPSGNSKSLQGPPRTSKSLQGSQERAGACVSESVPCGPLASPGFALSIPVPAQVTERARSVRSVIWGDRTWGSLRGVGISRGKSNTPCVNSA